MDGGWGNPKASPDRCSSSPGSDIPWRVVPARRDSPPFLRATTEWPRRRAGARAWHRPSVLGTLQMVRSIGRFPKPDETPRSNTRSRAPEWLSAPARVVLPGRNADAAKRRVAVEQRPVWRCDSDCSGCRGPSGGSLSPPSKDDAQAALQERKQYSLRNDATFVSVRWTR